MTRRKIDPHNAHKSWHRRPLPWRFDDWAAI